MTVYKKLLYLSVVLLIVGLGVATLFHSSAPARAPSLESRAPSARVTALAQEVTLTSTRFARPALVATTSDLFSNESLATSHNGRGLIEGSNGTVTVLDYDTKFTLLENDATGTHESGFLGSGSLWAHVEKVFGAGEYYQVKTQNAVAVVRGTSFSVSYRGGVTTLVVAAGTVAFTPLDGSGTPRESAMVLVTAGHKAVVDASGEVRVSLVTTDDTDLDWYVFNTSSETTTFTPKSNSVNTKSVSQPRTTGTSPVSATPSPNTPSTQTSPASSATPTGATTPPSVSASATTVAAGDTCSSFSDAGGAKGASLKLTSVSPSTVSESSSGEVTLTGLGFDCVTRVTVGSQSLDGESGFTVVSNSSITIPASGLPLGTFDLTMTDSLGNRTTLTNALTVTR